MFDQEAATRIVRKVLAADFACAEKYFDEEGVFIFPAREMAGRRRFPFREKSLAAVTRGKGVVVSCNDDRLAWARKNLGGLTRDDVFSVPTLARMNDLVAEDGQRMTDEHLSYLATPESFRAAVPPPEIEISSVQGDGIDELREIKGFPNALTYALDPVYPSDMAATVARHKGQIVGIAGVSADSDEMWQVGIDVVAEYRVRSIGKALVGRLTELVFALGKLPYYTTGPANIPSQRLALTLGYLPTWTEVYAYEPRR